MPEEPKKPLSFDIKKTYRAIISTSKGDIVCELKPQAAPLSVTNFIQLSKAGFYDGLTFHRVVPGFVIQGGDPQGDGTGGPGYTLPAEISLSHGHGALCYARLPDSVNPEKRSSGSQFYITLDQIPYLDGEYTVFGQTVEGLENIEKIEKGDKINKITIEIL